MAPKLQLLLAVSLLERCVYALGPDRIDRAATWNESG